MKKVAQERRISQRYDTALKVYYQVAYDVKTKVRFQVVDDRHEKLRPRKYYGTSRNVSVNGLSFVSKKKLDRDDHIALEIYAPNTKSPVHMRGEVRWAHTILGPSGKRIASRVGVEIVSVEGKSVVRSLHYDKKYSVIWSVVLDSLFGNFKSMVRHLKHDSQSAE
jgi:hypothetical protein